MADEAEEPDPNAPPEPLPVHALTLSFDFEMTEVPLPEPPPAPEPVEGEEPPAAEEEVPPLRMAGTYFSLTIPGMEEGAEPTTYELAHPLSGEEPAPPPSSSAELSISEAFVTWLVVEAQGTLTLVLRRRGVDGAEDEDVCTLPVDVGALLFGKRSAAMRFEDLGPQAAEHVGTVSSEGVAFSMEGATPLPQWYLDAIPKLEGPAYVYSGQRLNQQDTQKEMLRAALAKLQREQNIQMTYNKEFLWADSVGDREPRKPRREQIAGLKPDAHLAPWDVKQPIVHNKDGTLSQFRILQPSDYRSEELKQPWDEEELLRSQRPIQPPQAPPPGAMRHKTRWDPNPCPNDFLDEDIHERMRSVFSGQTEEQIAAEIRERVDGAIDTWKSKLVVDDPVLRVDLRSESNHAAQNDKLTSVLKNPPAKKALKSLYRGKTPLKLAAEPSAFTLSAPYEEADTRGLALTWRSSSGWKSSGPGDVTMKPTLRQTSRAQMASQARATLETALVGSTTGTVVPAVVKSARMGTVSFAGDSAATKAQMTKQMAASLPRSR